MTRDIVPEIDMDYLLDTLRQMVRINSVIPEEQLLAEFIAGRLLAFGVEPEWHEVAPGRPNVYASARLGPSPRSLVLSGHEDTVGVAEGWPVDPFELTERNGWLYGLGSADMKGGLACALAAFKAVVESGEEPDRGVIAFAATVDEEGYGTGARALLQSRYAGSSAILLAEPEYGADPDNPICTGMTGKVLYRLAVRGRAAHAFSPENGVNAVEDAARIVANLDRLPIGSHAAMGRGNISTLKIDGGYREYAVVVPEHCEVIVTRLLVGGESRASAAAEMQALVDSLGLASQVAVETPPPFYEPYLLEPDAPILAALRGSYREVFGREPYCAAGRGITDANIYVPEGKIPTVVFGPNGRGLHEAGECVELASLRPVAEVYVKTALRFWGQT